MYLKHWGLAEFPFENVSNPRFFFESDTHKLILDDLQDAIFRRKGAISLTGNIGCGKSTLSQKMLLSLPEKDFDIALITHPRFNPIEMLQELCSQLDISPTQQDRNHLLHSLQDHLIQNANQGRSTLICIDEAQSIPCLETFEELRLLLNFQLGNRFLLSLFFVGQPELKQQFSKLPQLQQRIALQLNITEMQAPETTQYILHRLRAAGCTQAILSKQAVAHIHQHTEGVPRRINHLMDRCLLIGMRKKIPLITAELVETTIQSYPC
ncbi:MAG: AAA family ATPase [Mariprofundaceae bacterium]